MSGSGVRYGQYCPVSRALEVIGERWTLLIVRDMLLGTTRFNDLARGLPGLSRSLLTTRLRHLERAGVVERLRGEYLLTDAGLALRPIVFGLGAWGARWSFDEPDPDELDAELLVWWMHDRLDLSMLPGRRHVLALVFADEGRRFWIVEENGVASVCHTDPGYGVDATVSADVRTLYRVWMGTMSLRQAVRDGRVTLDGPSAVTRRMSSVLRLSAIAPTVAKAAAQA